MEQLDGMEDQESELVYLNALRVLELRGIDKITSELREKLQGHVIDVVNRINTSKSNVYDLQMQVNEQRSKINDLTETISNFLADLQQIVPELSDPFADTNTNTQRVVSRYSQSVSTGSTLDIMRSKHFQTEKMKPSPSNDDGDLNSAPMILSPDTTLTIPLPSSATNQNDTTTPRVGDTSICRPASDRSHPTVDDHAGGVSGSSTKSLSTNSDAPSAAAKHPGHAVMNQEETLSIAVQPGSDLRGASGSSECQPPPATTPPPFRSARDASKTKGTKHSQSHDTRGTGIQQRDDDGAAPEAPKKRNRLSRAMEGCV